MLVASTVVSRQRMAGDYVAGRLKGGLRQRC